MSRLNSLRLLESYLEDLESLVEESNRLAELEADTSGNDYELNKNLSKIKKFLERNDDGYVSFDILLCVYASLLTVKARIMMNWWIDTTRC
jgi:hypothetical protein